jgi:hypothetical protein
MRHDLLILLRLENRKIKAENNVSNRSDLLIIAAFYFRR